MIQNFENSTSARPFTGAEPAGDRILTFAEVLSVTRLSRSTLARLISEGDGPPRLRLSARRIGFRLSDVRSWLDARARA